MSKERSGYKQDLFWELSASVDPYTRAYVNTNTQLALWIIVGSNLVCYRSAVTLWRRNEVADRYILNTRGGGPPGRRRIYFRNFLVEVSRVKRSIFVGPCVPFAPETCAQKQNLHNVYTQKIIKGWEIHSCEI